MAKTIVIEQGDGEDRVPFLRGILTRSLQRAGLSFDDAYAVATSVRDQFDETAEITKVQLQGAVLEQIEGFGPAVVRRYQHPAAPDTVLIRDAFGQTRPFSRERHRLVLESSGLSYETSSDVTAAIFRHLMRRSRKEVQSSWLGLLTYRYVRLSLGSEAARRYLVLSVYLRKQHPLVLLLGGAPGTGKSAVATEIAQRLDIVRIQSTDLLREVMRAMVPERLLPVLHRSSYNAWEALPAKSFGKSPSDDQLVDGYRAHAELLAVSCEAVVARSLREATSLILEGVHVQPRLVENILKDADVIVVPVMLAILNPEQLRERFHGRGEECVDRRAERYLEYFPAIWRLQTHLLSEADHRRIPIIVNYNREQVVRDVLATIIQALSNRLTATPAEVFD